jgi:hypothetical protein
MSANDKPKKVTRYRVKQGERWAKITTDFDERGVLVFTDDIAQASSWACEYHASLIVARTQRVQEWVRRSELAGWKKFEPLLELKAPSYEPVEVTPAEAAEMANR